MIKNLLYSLFLHFLLFLCIYANFNLKENDDKKTAEIAVSLIALNGDENALNAKQNQEIKNTEKPKPVKKIKTKSDAAATKVSKKNLVKEVQKKQASTAPAKSTAKPISEDKKEEFKPQETETKIQKEIEKKEEPKEEIKHAEDEETKTANTEKDLGAEKKDEKNNEESEAKTSNKNSATLANNIETLNLSAREKFNIQSQLKRCYNRAVEETKMESNLKIMVKAQISEDGYIDSDLADITDHERYNNPQEPNYKIAIDNARRALDLCSPLRNLPLEKYEVWKEVVLEFGKED